MRASRALQPLTYDVRLPDEAQADALRLLDASRVVVNQALEILWSHLDEFGTRQAGPAWKEVGKYMGSPDFHGDRQWRCESEVVGRLLHRAQIVAVQVAVNAGCSVARRAQADAPRAPEPVPARTRGRAVPLARGLAPVAGPTDALGARAGVGGRPARGGVGGTLRRRR